MTKRNGFSDFSITAEVRIVRDSVGLVLRAEGPGRYYLVQFDFAGNPSAVWFHTFTPSAERGYRLELVPSAHTPQAGVWYQMRVVARSYTFEVLLGEADSRLQHCACWEDSKKTYRQGTVGVWQHGGEAGEYRNLRVEAAGAGEIETPAAN